MKFSVPAKATAVAVMGVALLASASGASATSFLLKDTGTGLTDVLNTTGELTGGDSTVKASSAGKAFIDTALFSVTPGEELTSYSLTNLPIAAPPKSRKSPAARWRSSRSSA
jgi:hypothetical protein